MNFHRKRFTLACRRLTNLFKLALLTVGLIAGSPGVVGQTCAPIPGGLVGWWTAENSAQTSFGTNNGTVVSNVTYSSGVVGQAFTIDGNRSGIIVSNDVPFRLQNFSVECWIERSSSDSVSSDANGGEIFSYGAGGYAFALKDDGRLFLTRIEVSEVISDLAVVDQGWHHVGMTKNGTNVVFYVDGVGSAAPVYVDTFSFNSAVAIGCRGDNLHNSFFGSIDEIAFYNHALSPEEMAALYNAGPMGKCTNAIAPVIDRQPTDQGVVAGATATFDVYASGSPPLAFQWQFQGTNVASGTSASLVLNNSQPAMAGSYRVIITNASGSVTSAPANLVIRKPPVINQQPQSASVIPGATIQFVVGATGDPVLMFQWMLNGTNLAFGTNYTLLLSNVQPADAGTYRVIVSNNVSSVTSAAATLSLNFPPTITNQPQGIALSAGLNARFDVGVTGTPAFAYQWRLGNTNIPGATNSVLRIADVQSTNAGTYYVSVSNNYGQALSDGAILTVSNAICAAVPSGIVGWWQVEETNVDSATGNTGTLIGNSTVVPGKSGNAFAFDGNGDALGVGSAPLLQLQNFTMEAWIKRATTARASFNPGGGIIFGFGTGGYAVALLDDGRLFLTQIGISQLTSTAQISDTNWHHIGVIKDGTVVVFFLDGVAYPAQTSFTSVFQFNTQAAVGARGDTYANSFQGLVDELTIYNRALSAAEIQAIYFASTQGKCGMPLTWLNQPTNQVVPLNSNAVLNASLAGSRPIHYQWFQNGSTIPPATNSTLLLQKITFFQGGGYSLGATNSLGGIQSTNGILTVQPPTLLPNGGFDSGTLNGWAVTDIASPLTPVSIRTNGYNNGFGFFSSAPFDGNYCLIHGFDGNGPGRIRVAFDIVVPTAPTTLSFTYRIAWDMQNYGGSTQARVFNVVVEPYGGGTALQTNTILTALPGSANYDTGAINATMDLSSYSGQAIRISFDCVIPEAFTGPGFFELDKVALTAPPVPPLLITKAGSNIVLSWPTMFTNFAPIVSSGLVQSASWSIVNTNGISQGATNNFFTEPIRAGTAFYRLRSQ